MKVKERIEGDEPKLPRQSRAPRRLQQSNPHVFATAKDFLRSKYFEILDLGIQCLQRRISNKAVAVLSAIEELTQKAWFGKAFSEQSVEDICQHYRDEFDERRLQAQLLCLPNLRSPASEANLQFHDIMLAVGGSPMNAMIPDVLKLLTFYSVCPSSTATAERMQLQSSEAHQNLQYLRNTMSQPRLVCMMLLSAYPETEMVDSLDIDKLMNELILRRHARRRTFSMQCV